MSDGLVRSRSRVSRPLWHYRPGHAGLISRRPAEGFRQVQGGIVDIAVGAATIGGVPIRPWVQHSILREAFDESGIGEESPSERD